MKLCIPLSTRQRASRGVWKKEEEERERERETWSEGQQNAGRQAGREGGRRGGQEGGEKVRKVLDKGRMSKEQWEAQEVCPRRRGVSRRGQL